MAQSGSTQSTLTIEVLHHWLAATVIPKPLTTAIPATHMPSPSKKLASLGTCRRTTPSPPASHAHGTRRRGGVPVVPTSVPPPSGIEAVVTRGTEARAIGSCGRSALRFLGVLMHDQARPPPGGPVRTVGAYSSSCSRPSKTWLLTISRATSG